MASLIVSLILFITKLLQYSKKVDGKLWQFICMGFDALWAFFYLISANLIIKWARFVSFLNIIFMSLLKRKLEFQMGMWYYWWWSIFWLLVIDLLSG